MVLYGRDTSGNTRKVVLALAFMDIPHEKVVVDRQNHKLIRTPELMRGNPRGLIPKLEVDGKIFWDSTAILIYLARRFGGEQWLPIDPDGMAEVAQWLALAQNEILVGVAYSRAVTAGRRQGDLEKIRALGRVGLATMEARLSNNDWLALDRMTIADCACFPHVSVAHEGGITLDEYPGVLAWVRRIQKRPGYSGMPGDLPL
jgi:glutathione S-transferase